MEELDVIADSGSFRRGGGDQTRSESGTGLAPFRGREQLMQKNRIDAFTDRWRAARLLLLRSFLTEAANGSEEELIARISETSRAQLLQALREESGAAAADFRREWGRALTVDEIAELLGGSGIRCFEGLWRSESHCFSRYRYRGECARRPGLFLCDYWREAAAGAVEGLASGVAFARHRSLDHGDDACLDYLYVTARVERRWGLVPAMIRRALDKTVRELRDRGCVAQLIGVSEKMLFVRLNGIERPLSEKTREASLGLLRARSAPLLFGIALAD
jgi:hypothetical protein